MINQSQSIISKHQPISISPSFQAIKPSESIISNHQSVLIHHSNHQSVSVCLNPLFPNINPSQSIISVPTWLARLLNNSSCCLVRLLPSKRHNSNSKRWWHSNSNSSRAPMVRASKFNFMLSIQFCIFLGGFPQPHAEYSTDTVIYKGGPPAQQPPRGPLPSVSFKSQAA